MTAPASEHDQRKTLLDVETGVQLAVMAKGDALAKQHGYKTLKGLEACRYYLMVKHNWLPRDVMSMTPRELEFALLSELED